jgi:hypothetical protein
MPESWQPKLERPAPGSLAREPRRITVSTSWESIYGEFKRLTGSEMPEAQKQRFRRIGKARAINELEALAQSTNNDSVFAWGSKTLGMEVPTQRRLT